MTLRRISVRSPGFCLALVLAVVWPARAELPVARLTSIFPPGAKQGSTLEVTSTGQDLDDLASLHFSDRRITAKRAAAANAFVVSVAADVPPGIYDVRAVGRFGITNPRAFAVGTLAEAVNKPGNVTAAAATPVALGQTVSAVAEANAVHHFMLALKKGRRILARVEAREIDSRMAPCVTLADADGRERVVSRRGELVDFTADADGDYLIKVHDVTFRGGPEFFYRLSVHAGPHIDFVIPASGLPGTRSRYQLFGRNLGSRPPDGTLEQLSVDIELPAADSPLSDPLAYVPSTAAFLDGIDYRLTTAHGVSNPARIYFASAPVVLRDQTAGPQRVSPPCEIVGRLRPRGGQDCFTFDAPANAVFWVEVFSSRLGHPAAPFLLIQRVSKDDKGAEKIVDVQEVYESSTNVGGPEFKTASRDPAFRLEVKTAGTYRVLLRNLFSTDLDEAARVYRLAIRAESPDFRLAAYPAPPIPEKDSKDVPLCTPLLRRGGVTPIKVIASREDGFAGEIQLAVEGLPPGVTCPQASIPPSAASAVLLLCAAEDAQPVVAPLRITGTAIVAGGALTRHARPGTIATSTYAAADKVVDVSSRRARELFVAVAPEPSPLSILPKDPSIEARVSGKVSIGLKVVRRGEFTAPIPLKLAGHPLLAPLKEVTVAPTVDAASIDLDLSQVKLPPGTYDLHVETLAKLKYAAKPPAKEVTASFYSPPIRLVVAPPPPATNASTKPQPK
jgi:hypothetical protein